jgi:hypothetical protein
MNKRVNAPHFFLFLLFLFHFSAIQAQIVIKSVSDNYWQCTSSDKEHNQWLAKSQFELSATNRAMEACKKQSQYPQSCKAPKESCDAIINGYSTRPMWQCTALDVMAKPWRSSFYVQRDDAALGAKNYCRQKSSLPDTCYINLLTCNNLNERM